MHGSQDREIELSIRVRAAEAEVDHAGTVLGRGLDAGNRRDVADAPGERARVVDL